MMAQTNSSGQGTNGVADESPNMIVYRKVRQLLFLVCTCVCVFVSLRECNSLTSVYLIVSIAKETADTNGKAVIWLI